MKVPNRGFKCKRWLNVEGGVATVRITTTHGVYDVLLDEKHLDKLEKVGRSWNKIVISSSRGYRPYAEIRVGDAKHRLHNFLMDRKPGSEVDHINFNTLDNRSSNLELVSHSENMKRSWKVRKEAA